MSQNTLNLIESLYGATGGKAEIGTRLGLVSKGWLTITDQGESWGVAYTHKKNVGETLGKNDVRIDVGKSTGELFTFFDRASNNIFAREGGGAI